ncbi:MAG: hypothetical protein H0W25_19140 [Acidimicrobiia bacterium]|nr:hypothetical protein [Acidimicrobiia bacterium]
MALNTAIELGFLLQLSVTAGTERAAQGGGPEVGARLRFVGMAVILVSSIVISGASAHTVAPQNPHWHGWDEPVDLRIHYPVNFPVYGCTAYNGNSQTGWCNNVVQAAAESWAANSDFDPIRNDSPTYVGGFQWRIDNYGQNGLGGWVDFAYSNSNGHMTYVAAYLNPSLLNFPHLGSGANGDTTVQKRCAAAHEWGHIAGLRHHASTTNSIMYEPGPLGAGHESTCHVQGMTNAQPHDHLDVNVVH